MLLPHDDLHRRALDAARSLRGATFVTSDSVFVEVLAYVGGIGEYHRRQAVQLVHASRGDANTEVIPQTRNLFDLGLELYGNRSDKAYSLVDCMSMVICKDHEITSVLTHDHHFAQEGFDILL